MVNMRGQSSISLNVPFKARALRGQSSMELLVTFSTVLVFTVPVLLLLLTVSQYGFERSSVVQADSSARVIADNLNELAAQGEGAKRELLLNLPSNTKYLNISRGEVVIGVSLSTGIYEAAAPFYANVSVPYDVAISGLYPLSIESTNIGLDVHGP